MNEAYKRYEAELEKLRQLAAKRDWTVDGELRWVRQLNQTKQAYLAACGESERENAKVWR